MILFQLIFACLLFFTAALVFGIVLAGIFFVWALVKRSNKPSDIGLRGFSFSFKLFPYFLLSIVLSVASAEWFRDVDPALGDYWSLKLNDSINLQAIDSATDWYIAPITGGERLSGSVKSVAESGEFAFGQLCDGTFYIFDKSLSKLTIFADKHRFDAALNLSNIPQVPMLAVNDYYRQTRQLGDFITMILLMIYPLMKLVRLVVQTNTQLNKPN